MLIEDGNGTEYLAGVDTNHRLKTKSTTHSEIHYESVNNANAFDFSVGDFVNITSADTETGVMYLKNTSTTRSIVLYSIRTCANQAHKVKLYRNPTDGTLISGAIAGTKSNLNFGSSKDVDATVYKGQEGSTVSGNAMTQHISGAGHSVLDLDGSLILTPGDSLSLSMELVAAGDCCVRIIGFVE